MSNPLTVLSGATIALVVRKIVPSPALGPISDMLLGITGAFAAMWILEEVHGVHVPTEAFGVVSAVFGAAVLVWAAHVILARTRLVGSDRNPR